MYEIKSLRDVWRTHQALFDLVITVSSLALKVHARMIGNMTPFCTKEAFVNIVDTLLRLYKDKTRANLIPIQGTEISFKKKSHLTILQIYKLLVISLWSFCD